MGKRWSFISYICSFLRNPCNESRESQRDFALVLSPQIILSMIHTKIWEVDILNLQKAGNDYKSMSDYDLGTNKVLFNICLHHSQEDLGHIKCTDVGMTNHCQLDYGYRSHISMFKQDKILDHWIIPCLVSKNCFRLYTCPKYF